MSEKAIFMRFVKMTEEQKLASLRERLSASYTPEPNTGCWLWGKSLNHKGYGEIGFGKGVVLSAHRASWLIHNGPIPVGLHVLHRCDVRACINPNHLFLGTNADNNADMNAKGRARPCRGSANGRAKLSEADVAEIIAKNMMPREITARFGVSRATGRRVRSGRNWGHAR